MNVQARSARRSRQRRRRSPRLAQASGFRLNGTREHLRYIPARGGGAHESDGAGSAPGARCGLSSCRCRRPAPARSWSGSRPARCAGPICTWSTASCLSRSCRSCRATRSSARWRAPGAASTGSARASASASPGSATPAPGAVIAPRARRTCATRRGSPVIRSMAATPNTPWPMPATAFRSMGRTPTTRRRRCCARG